MCGDEESASDVRGKDEGRASDARETRGVGCARTWETRGARRPRRVGCAGGHEGRVGCAGGGDEAPRRGAGEEARTKTGGCGAGEKQENQDGGRARTKTAAEEEADAVKAS